jgi:tetratricopeptide (TPR) repeat protein
MIHSRTGRTIALSILLIAAVLLLYGQVMQHHFLSFDDNTYITQNRHVREGLTAEGLRWAFTTSHADNWHPLTWLSHMLDCELFGLQPGPHLLVNASLHAINALLLFLALRLLTGSFWPSLLAALLFALHPLRVESVAWASERKDLLSGLFFMLALLAYGFYTRKPQAVRYILLFLCMALGLMAKPMLVTLPFVLLLLDLWPLGRWKLPGLPSSRLLLEKLPLLALAAASSVVTLIAQRSGGAMSSVEALPLSWRLTNALNAYAVYLWNTVWPDGLAFYYPHPRSSSPYALLSLLLLTAITLLVVRYVKRAPYLGVGWLWFLGTLIPVIGLVQVGSQAMADRYTYIPSIGLYIAFAWGLAAVLSRRPALRPVAIGIVSLLLIALSSLTWIQIGHWRDSGSLYQHAIEVTEGNYLAHNGLGNLFLREGRLEEAAFQFERALAAAPDFADAHNNLGLVLKNRGDLAGAAERYRHAIRVRPGFAQAHSNLGNVLARQGDFSGAAEQFGRAIEIDPGRPGPYINLGNLYVRQGLYTRAVAEYEKAIEIEPMMADAHKNIAVALEGLGKMPRAVEHYRRALELDPGMRDVAEHLESLRQGQKGL